MRRFLKIAGGIVLLACVAVLATLYWMGTWEGASVDTADAPTASTSPPVANPSEDTQRIERGRYLALVGNCAGCHTVAGGQRYAGGTAIPTPFGTLYGPNITPDPDAGIGSWDADDFWRALHAGKSKDGTLLYPAFPYTEYTRVSRADSDALFAYLRTVPASPQPSPAHQLKFPYDQRGLLAFWRALYFTPGGLSQDQGQSEQWNRGRYLVEGLGHCAACHSPRNRWGATQGGLSGAMITGLGWYAPPLTNEADGGLGDWSAQDIATLLRTGIAAHSTALGPMAEVVVNSSQHLTQDDALAMGVYLKSLPAGPVPTGITAPSTAVMTLGAKLYGQYCAQCHRETGEGHPGAWPALTDNPTVTASSPVNAIRVLLDGGFAPATAANPRPHGMPPFGQVLGDNDIAALVSYIRASWGNRAGAVTAFDVKRVRDGARVD
ncbi:cytochrome c [Bordetella sp. 15P40C-2]|uniref:c-type cytochrome n=1 Tax=Bordetella sp. 15P40C-2 TaxID=2572246 RepID=UPI0013266060|nr:cytochrome c [Bordetella sp. 15P40C-2]MVW71975.1 c-type cytochrome [Bordetella sp. 15P40C-2]